jgi:hypothetical protein
MVFEPGSGVSVFEEPGIIKLNIFKERHEMD